MKKKLHFRSWFYFRTGYTQYFAFVLAIANMLTTTYYLAIVKNPLLGNIFTSFSIYIIIFSVIGIPLLTIIGFIHMRRSFVYSSEQDILQESWPYNYYLLPGIQKEIVAPLLHDLLMLGRKSISDENITESETKKLNELQQKLEFLVSGGSLDMPKKFGKL